MRNEYLYDCSWDDQKMPIEADSCQCSGLQFTAELRTQFDLNFSKQPLSTDSFLAREFVK